MGEAKRRKQADPNFGQSKLQQNITVPPLEITPDYEHLVNLYLAQSGGQLIIPGFSSGLHGTVSALPSMDILGKPKRIPEIRGLIVEP